MKPDEHQNQEPTFEVVESAVEAMTRGEMNSQIEIAKRNPRSMEKFTKRALSMATIDEETAESCLYRRPVGKENGKPVFAEGMSVRMAEIVGASYGNLRVYATIISQTPRQVVARGMAIDLESNFASSSECVESTVDKTGRPYSERQAALIAKVALAKARRDATFQVVPRALAKPVEAAVRNVLSGGGKTIAQRRMAVLSWINKIAVEPARVWSALGIAGELELDATKLETLTGIKTALQEREMTIDEAFPPVKAETTPKTASGTTSTTANPATQHNQGATISTPSGTTAPAEQQNAAKSNVELEPSIEDLFKTAINREGLDVFQLYRWLRNEQFGTDLNPVTLDSVVGMLAPKQVTWLFERFPKIVDDVRELMDEAKAGLTASAPAPKAAEPQTATVANDESPLGMLRTKTKEHGLTEAQVVDWARSAKKIAAGISTFDGIIETSPSIVTYMVNNFAKIAKAIAN